MITSEISRRFNGMCFKRHMAGPQSRAMRKANAQNGFLDRFEDILEKMLICLRSIREGSNDSLSLEIESKKDKNNGEYTGEKKP